MDKKSCVVPKEPRGKEVMGNVYRDLKELPFKKRRAVLNKQPEEDVRPPPVLYVELSFPNEDLSRLGKKYRFLGSSLPANEDHKKLLGFIGEIKTQMFKRDKKAKLPRKSPHALSRSLFNKGFTHKDQSQKNDDAGRSPSIREFVARAKARARARIDKKKGKKVQSTCVARCGKKKEPEKREPKKKGPKIRSIDDIEEATKNQCVFI